MPPENGERRPSTADARIPTIVESSTLRKLPMAFQWVACPLHRWFGPAGAIVVPGAGPWCAGDGATAGHWVDAELERAA